MVEGRIMQQKMRIESDINYGGNPHRGYYDNKGTVTFIYEPDAEGYFLSFTEEKEQEIIKAMYGEMCMWYKVSLKSEVKWKQPDLVTSRTWNVHYGYDSGD